MSNASAKTKNGKKELPTPVTLSELPLEEQRPFIKQTLILLRPVRREFKSGLLGEIKRRQHFISPAERDRLKRANNRKKMAKGSNRLEVLDTDPFYRILGAAPWAAKLDHTEFKPAQPHVIGDDLNLDLASNDGTVPILGAVVPARVVSVFVVAKINSSPAKFVIQKIAKKAEKGFPGGTIEEGENLLDAAEREFVEESCDCEGNGGVSIGRYAPTAIGDFELNMAQAGERGAVAYVELPAEERCNLRVGGGQVAEEECVEHIYLPTFEQVECLADNQELLPNSLMVWYVYKKFFGLIR